MGGLLTPEDQRLALGCPRCYWIRGAIMSWERAEMYDDLPCLQGPIYATAREFAKQGNGKECKCGLELDLDFVAK